MANKNRDAIMQERDIEKVAISQKIWKIIVTVVIYTFLFAVAISVLFPFYWMINSSLKSLEEYKWNIPSLYPHTLKFVNYVTAFKEANLGRLFLNTL